MDLTSFIGIGTGRITFPMVFFLSHLPMCTVSGLPLIFVLNSDFQNHGETTTYLRSQNVLSLTKILIRSFPLLLLQLKGNRSSKRLKQLIIILLLIRKGWCLASVLPLIRSLVLMKELLDWSPLQPRLIYLP